MKPLFVLLLVIVSVKVAAQTDSRIFYSQLMVVFSDLDKNFEFLRGDLKDIDGLDSLYESNTHLEGTKENSIFVSSDLHAYQAMINEAISKDGSQLLLKAWKEKLTNALSDSFSELEKEYHSKDAITDGYQYSSEKIIILLLRHKANDDTYWTNLVIKAK